MSLLLHLYLHSGRNATKRSDYQGSAYERLEDHEGQNSIGLNVYNLAPDEEATQELK
jgi:hypothetical protein